MPTPHPAATTPPSFVDLRQFARDPSQGSAVAAAPGEDRFLASRRRLNRAPGPVTAKAMRSFEERSGHDLDP